MAAAEIQWARSTVFSPAESQRSVFQNFINHICIPESAAYLLAIQPLHSNRVQKHAATCSARARAGRVRAANLPVGVEVPKVQPRLSEPFLGFTKTEEVWNSRASMIGLIGVFIVELVLKKGVLQMIGV